MLSILHENTDFEIDKKGYLRFRLLNFIIGSYNTKPEDYVWKVDVNQKIVPYINTYQNEYMNFDGSYKLISKLITSFKHFEPYTNRIENLKKVSAPYVGFDTNILSVLPYAQWKIEISEIQNLLTITAIKEIRKTVTIPIMLMGYINQLIKYDIATFLEKAANAGVDGFILPDLPLDIYQENYKNLFEKYNLKMSFLITPQTSDSRVKIIAKESTAFLYVVSSFAITGSKSDLEETQLDYFKKIKSMNLITPKLIGFGISNKATFQTACNFADGAIIGSAFIKKIKPSNDFETTVSDFVKSLR